MVAQDTFLTPEGQRKLQAELRYLVEVRRPEVATLIGEAKGAGDVMENSAYDEAKDQQAFVEARIREVQDILSRARIIEPRYATDEVTIGCEVVVAKNGEAQERFRIVGSVEANPSLGFISNESPLGRALLGKRAGDRATVETPSGDTLVFEIVQVG